LVHQGVNNSREHASVYADDQGKIKPDLSHLPAQ
jgi:hypothetical protein